MSQGRSTPCFGDGRPPTFNRNPYNGYINPYYWVDDHPLLYGNNGSLDPGTYDAGINGFSRGSTKISMTIADSHGSACPKSMNFSLILMVNAQGGPNKTSYK